MTNTPLKNYGFNYEYNGKEFAFHIVASTKEEALDRASAMRDARCVGELHEETSNAIIQGPRSGPAGMEG